jgi:NAD(P)-dependent dehydrogenase (short-subunit alcohol dehydrogenase family)
VRSRGARSARGTFVAAVTAGIAAAALGAGGTAGAALLLFTGQGFLSTAGFLVAVLLMALAGGLWVGALDADDEERMVRIARRRWIWAIAAWAVAAAFSQVWAVSITLRDLAIGGALAVLFILAEPAYTVGGVLAGIHARHDGHGPGTTAAAALGGAAIGILLASTQLIPRWDAPLLFFGAAVALAAAGTLDGFAGTTRTEGRTMSHVVLITGVGDRGQLGFALAEYFLHRGARVAITARTPRVGAFADELGRLGEVIAEPGDLTSEDDAARIVRTTIEHFGRIDALVNAAGGLSISKPIANTDPEEWTGEIVRNAETALVITRAALPALRDSRGAIVYFASPAGLRARPGLGAYSAAKAAVIALTRALAVEEKENGVRVNAIAPGLIDTEQNRATAADPATTTFVPREDVAGVAWFLTTEAARSVTGEVVSVLGKTIR